MCGIVGLRRLDGGTVDVAMLRAMAAQLHHRGPDGDGFAVFGDVGFGHTRLSIIDVAGSPQPMASANGPFHITYNGEVFNYRELAARLRQDGVRLVTQGDTEVLLELCRRQGPSALAQVNGQFAFACHDTHTGELWLARDRLGILPLYWWTDGRSFAFASEIKALLPVIGDPQLDDDALEEYLIYRSVPPPRTLFRGVRKLTPGTVLHVGRDGTLREEAWWRLPATPSGRMLTGADAIAAVEQLLADAVRLRLVADVPVGAYLSGGLDSSLTVALMRQARAGGTVATFSAGFADPRYDELPYAREVSRHLGTAHHEIVVTAADFERLWPRLTWHRDGPMSEPADVAVFLLAQQARTEVKVLLSGEGSDEIFAGYPKHAFETRLRALAALPGLLRVPLFRAADRLLPGSRSRARTAARALAARTPGERMQTWFAPFTWYERRALRPGYGAVRDPGQWDRAGGDHLRRMLYVDCHTWLSDNLLERGDRMSMAASVENRPPFLDHRLVELAFQLDSSLKIRGGSSKWIVKQIAQKHLPAAIVHRRKVGFRVPLDEWFRGGLRDFANDLLLGSDSFVGRWFDRGTLAGIVADHEQGRRNEELRLWTLLGLEVFQRQFFRAKPVAATA